MSGRMGHALCAVLLLAGGTAGAAEFWESLDRAIRLQLEENFEDAIAAYQQAQIERPEAEIVYYGLGSTYYQQGAALESSGEPGALEAFQHAAAAFDKLENASDPDLRREAAYGAASARARAARLAAGMQAQEENPVRAFQDVVENLEAFLEQYPDHDAARHNLDSVRMQLKQILQEPPPPPQPEQQPGDENEDEGEEEQQEQEQSRGQQGEEQDPQESQDGEEQDPQESQDGEESDAGSQPEASPDEEQPDQEMEGEQPQPSQPEEEEGEEEQDASAAADVREEEQEHQMSATEQGEQKDMPNIEAILQSLEDMDRREQREQRTGAGGPEVRGAWW